MPWVTTPWQRRSLFLQSGSRGCCCGPVLPCSPALSRFSHPPHLLPSLPPPPPQLPQESLAPRAPQPSPTQQTTASRPRPCSKMLAKAPEQRITLEEVMRHPWYVQDCPDDLLDVAAPRPPRWSEQELHAIVDEVGRRGVCVAWRASGACGMREGKGGKGCRPGGRAGDAADGCVGGKGRRPCTAAVCAMAAWTHRRVGRSVCWACEGRAPAAAPGS